MVELPLKPELVEVNQNYVVFRSLDDNFYLYENHFGTIHKLNAESERIKEALHSLPTERRFGHDKAKLSERLESLDTLVLNVTEACNLTCDYCIFSGNYSSDRINNNSNRMPEEVAFKALDIFLDRCHSKPYVMFYGGEPMIEIGLIEKVIERARKRTDLHPEFGLTTNFILVERYLDYFVDNDVLLVASLDGFEETHDKWRGTGTHQRILRTLNRIAEEHPSYFERRLSLSVTLAEIGRLKDIRDYFSSHALLNRLPLHVQSVEQKYLAEQMKSRFRFPKEILEQSEIDFWSMARDYCTAIIDNRQPANFDKALFDLPLFRMQKRKVGSVEEFIASKAMCIPGARKLFVDAKGSFYTCEKLGGKREIGTIHDGLQLPKIETALDKFSDIRSTLCPNCWASRECSCCAATAKGIDDISVEGLRLNCNNLQQQVFIGLILYTYLLKSPNGSSKLEDYFSDYKP